MAQYYPRALVKLVVLFEDFKFTSDASLQKSYEFAAYAHNVSVVINDYSTADTFTADIDYKSLPFDPRVIRALGVKIYMEDIGKNVEPGGELRQVTQSVDTLTFVGFVDDEDITFDDSRRVVHLEGRDNTSLFIDSPWIAGTIALTDRSDKVITRIMNKLPATKAMNVEVRGVDPNTLPTLAAFAPADGDTKLGGQKNTARNESFWDVIQDIASRSSLIAYIELNTLVLTTPRVLYNPKAAKTFIYGSNITDLKMKRKLGRKKTFNVVVRSLVGKKVILAKIPLEATPAWCKAIGIPRGEIKLPAAIPGGGTKGAAPDPTQQLQAAPYMAFLVPNVKDKDHLITVAQNIYEEVSRQQIEGSFITRDMGVMDRDSNAQSEPNNMLGLRVGDPIEVLMEEGDLKGLQNVQGLTPRIAFLVQRGYSFEIAAAFAASMDKFATVFYTKAVTFTISDEDGFKAEVEYLNFIDTKYNSPGT